uniref:Uncharacterized protein n=1 Tax=Oryza glumipatula TaxID=40148 RepID=A0A0D9ZYF9_9ORYZ
MESVEAQDSISRVVPDSIVAMESVEALDSVVNTLESDVVLDSTDMVLNYVDMVPDFVEVLPNSVEVLPNAIDMVPDSVKVVQCARCGTFHASGIFGEACYQARHKARRCACCGLIHSDYDLTSWLLHDIEKFDCELYIPDMEMLEMNGDTIILPDHVQMKLDEIYNMKKLEDAKLNQDA